MSLIIIFLLVLVVAGIARAHASVCRRLRSIEHELRGVRAEMAGLKYSLRPPSLGVGQMPAAMSNYTSSARTTYIPPQNTQDTTQ